MASKNPRIIFTFIFILIIAIGIFLRGEVLAVEITATVKITVCGDGIIATGEQCDGSALGGASCVSRGFSSGTLSCSSSCEFNTSPCTNASVPVPSGGGGGGEGGGIIAPVVTSIVFDGRAYPKSAVTLLKDAQIAATTIAGADSNFQMTLAGLSAGNYVFSIYSEDSKGIRSSLMTFPVSVTSGVTTKVSGIFIAPTIAVDKSETKRGDNIAIFGQSIPQSDIVISVNSEEEFFGKTVSDKDGIYLYNFDSSLLETGQHFTKSKASIGNQLVSNWSHLVSFKVGAKNIAAISQKTAIKGELNNDNHVNLVDFSILLYNWGTPKNTKADLSGDGKVNLTDFSMMLYYWTG